MTTRLFTIGYEGWRLAAFLDCLSAHGIECVIDVRGNPFSRKPGFSSGPLSKALEGAGIRYVPLMELGTPKPLRDAVKSDGDYARFFRAMREHLNPREEALERARGCVARMTCCLMCYEKAVDTCHRKLVAQMIQDHTPGELDVVHLQAG